MIDRAPFTPDDMTRLALGKRPGARIPRAASEGHAAPKERNAQPEEILAISIAKTLKYAIGPALTCCNGVMWCAIEQASGRRAPQKNRSGRSFDIRGQRNRAKGVRSGIPDMAFWIYGRRAWIELKAGKNDTSDNQDAVHTQLRAAGDLVAVCRTHDDVLLTLRSWGVPLRAS